MRRTEKAKVGEVLRSVLFGLVEVSSVCVVPAEQLFSRGVYIPAIVQVVSTFVCTFA